MLRRLLTIGSILILPVSLCLGQVTMSPYNWISDGDVANDQSKAATAMAVRDAAISRLGAVEKNIQNVFEASPGYVKANADAGGAEAAYPSAHDKVIAALQDNADYKAAIAARDAAAKAVDEARASGETGSDIIPLATEAMHARGAVAKLQQTALEADADYQAAKRNLVATAAAMKGLEANLHSSMLLNPDYQAANAAVQVAVAQYEAASAGATAAAEGRQQEIRDEIARQARDKLNSH